MKKINKTETRELTGKIELRENGEGKRMLTGYAVKWEMKSQVLGFLRKFREQFKKGAFTESLEKDDQLFLWSHDPSKVLGRTKNGTLRLEEDDIGLRFELDLPNTTLGNDAYETIKRGDVDGVSFGFKVEADEIQDADDDLPLRTVTKARLFEVSVVAFPAYPDSEVSARGFDRIRQYDEERERQLLKIKILNNL